MEFEYEQFDIIEVAKNCGIQFYNRNTGGVEFKAQCPFCGDRKYHLGLNRKMERFHCFRCGEKGNSVSLFAKINGVSNKEAYHILRGNDVYYKPKVVSFRENTEVPIRPLEDRHTVYYDFLIMLRLDRQHRDNLVNRGLSFSQIHQFMYRSIPTDHVFRCEVLEKLVSMHNLVGIPGFYIDEYGDVQIYYKKCGGILVSVCNYEGYIKGCKCAWVFRLIPMKRNSDGFQVNTFLTGREPNLGSMSLAIRAQKKRAWSREP